MLGKWVGKGYFRGIFYPGKNLVNFYKRGKKFIVKITRMLKDSRFKDFILFVKYYLKLLCYNSYLKMKQYFTIAVIILITFTFLFANFLLNDVILVFLSYIPKQRMNWNEIFKDMKFFWLSLRRFFLPNQLFEMNLHNFIIPSKNRFSHCKEQSKRQARVVLRKKTVGNLM